MAIIYSYPQVPSIENSDLLIATRFENEERGFARTVSFSADTLGSYIVANHSNTLDQVLNTGNISLEDAKIGSIYLYNSFEPATLGYVSITGDKNAFNFYSVQGDKYAQISNGQLFIKGIGTNYGINIAAPTTPTAFRQATFQDASGTIAYLSDITTPSTYGLATQIANSTPITNSTEPGVLNGTNIIGTLTVPANGFEVGNSFNAFMVGHISNNNGVTLLVTVETVDGVVLGSTGAMNLNIATNKHWQLGLDFVIRQIGEAGTASIVTAGNFVYNKNSNNNAETFTFVTENSTTFDTTVENELVIKATWGAVSTNNSIYSNIFVLNKVY